MSVNIRKTFIGGYRDSKCTNSHIIFLVANFYLENLIGIENLFAKWFIELTKKNWIWHMQSLRNWKKSPFLWFIDMKRLCANHGISLNITQIKFWPSYFSVYVASTCCCLQWHIWQRINSLRSCMLSFSFFVCLLFICFALKFPLSMYAVSPYIALF